MVSSLRGQGTFTFSGVRVVVRVVWTAKVAFQHVVLALLADVYHCMPWKYKCWTKLKFRYSACAHALQIESKIVLKNKHMKSFYGSNSPVAKRVLGHKHKEEAIDYVWHEHEHTKLGGTPQHL